MGLLNRAGLLHKEERKVVKVDLGNDEFVYVCEMSGKMRDAFEQSMFRKIKVKDKTDYESDITNFRAKLAVATVCDEKGMLLLSTSDVTILSENMSAVKLMKIADAAAELNKLTPEEQEDLIKNSKGGETADSTSASAEN